MSWWLVAGGWWLVVVQEFTRHVPPIAHRPSPISRMLDDRDAVFGDAM
jgi:hypothetical protein